MTVGELRKALVDAPDWMDFCIRNANGHLCDVELVRVRGNYASVTSYPETEEDSQDGYIE